MTTMAREKPRPRSKLPWAKRLRDARTARGWNQKEAAAALRCSQGQISEYEAGKKVPPKPVQYLIELLEQEVI